MKFLINPVQWIRSIVFLFVMFISTNSAFASVGNDLNNFFNNVGVSSNTTNPNVYQGQQAGYYTGGSLFARNRVRDVQIAEVDLPQIRSGCGGIDLYTGGLSFINGNDLKNVMENILSNATSYAALLAWESTIPEAANAMKYLHTAVNAINSLNINSCETAAGLVGSVWPKTQEAQRQVCQDVGANNGIFTDYAAAHQGCGTGGQMASTLNKAPGAYQSLVFKSGNIAWKALMANSFMQGDTELAEFFMSLSGTVILNNPGSSDSSVQKYAVWDSIANDSSLLKALLHGGSATIYRCDETSPDGCLNLTKDKLQIPQAQALASQVAALLNDMVKRIYDDSTLTQAEIGLLNATRLPVYKMLNVQAAFAGSASVLNVQDYAEVIAADILFQYLEESLDVVQSSTASLQIPDALMTPFRQGMDAARADIRAAEGSAYAQITKTAQLITQTQSMEQMLSGSLSSQLNGSLQWANNLRE